MMRLPQILAAPRRELWLVSALLFIAYAFIFLYALPQLGWVHPEIYGLDQASLQAHAPWYKQIFHWRNFEYVPRHTRPLSSFFQMIDTAIRTHVPAAIAKIIPSVSFDLLLALLLNPWLFYRLLRDVIGDKLVCRLTLVLYILSATNLSSAVMMFRPGKILAQFFLLLAMRIIAGQARWKWPSYRLAALLGGTVFLGLISDEGGWFAPFAVSLFAFCYRRDNFWPVFASMILAAVSVILCYLVVFPYLSAIWLNLHGKLGEYDILYNITQAPDHAEKLRQLLRDIRHAIGVHLFAFPRDVFALYPFNGGLSPIWRLIFCCSAFGFVVWSLHALRGFSYQRRWPPHLACYAAICVLVGILMHSTLLSLVPPKLFGPYYYGGYITLFVLLGFAAISDHALQRPGSAAWWRPAYSVMATLLAVSLMHCFSATSTMMYYVHCDSRIDHHQRIGSMQAHFANKEDRFTLQKVITTPLAPCPSWAVQ